MSSAIQKVFIHIVNSNKKENHNGLVRIHIHIERQHKVKEWTIMFVMLVAYI